MSAHNPRPLQPDAARYLRCSRQAASTDRPRCNEGVAADTRSPSSPSCKPSPSPPSTHNSASPTTTSPGPSIPLRASTAASHSMTSPQLRTPADHRNRRSRCCGGRAALVDYARMRLKPVAGVPCAVEHVRQRGAGHRPYATPWRVLMIAGNPCRLLEQNDIIRNLNAPCASPTHHGSSPARSSVKSPHYRRRQGLRRFRRRAGPAVRRIRRRLVRPRIR